MGIWRISFIVGAGLLLATLVVLSVTGEGAPPPESFEIRTPTPTWVPASGEVYLKHRVYLPQVGVRGCEGREVVLCMPHHE